MTQFDVIVIGYGPAGATMANLLGQRGYRVAVIEQASVIYDKPRAITADHEAMRVFQACGLADDIASSTVPHPGTDFLGVEGQTIKQFYPQPPPHPLTWEPSWMFVQPELEATLRKGVMRFDQVHVFLEHEFVSLSQTAHSATVRTRSLEDGALNVFEARYVVACDGARSPVREQLSAAIDDLAFDENWIVVDAWLRGDIQMPPRCVQYCRPSRPGTYIVGPGQLRRWEIKMLPGETPADFADESAIHRVLSQFVNADALEVCRHAVYRFHALVVHEWRFGRVFLMGDAAHQMPPFLGQGLCAGIRDAINLVWKIDAVERLGASPQLLDTYGVERKPHVRTIVSHAKSFGLIIGELDEAAARERDARLLEAMAAGKAETVRQKFIPGLQSGLIDMDAKSQPRAGAGTLFVQPWVQTGSEPFRRLDDLVTLGFLLVSASGESLGWLDVDSTKKWQRLQGQQVLVQSDSSLISNTPSVLIVTERDGVFRKWLDELDAVVVLVRPDHYVYGSAKNATELKRLVDALYQSLYF
jgi:3-(3-hydroxy-phenyl)propionate hydroxylase